MASSTRAPVDRREVTDQMIAQLRTVVREMKCLGSQKLLRHGVSMAHMHVMSMLERHGELSMSRIAEALDVSFSNATGLVDRMEERGLVERVRDPDDRRVVHVGLTTAGRRVLEEIEVVRDVALRQVMSQLDDRQIARLATVLDDLKAAVQQVAVEYPDLFAHDHHPHDASASR